MIRMKKICALLLTLTLLICLLAGCGSSSSDSTETAETSQEEAAEEVDTEEPEEEAEPAEAAAETSEAASTEVEGTAMTATENEAMFPLEENVSYSIYYPFSPGLISMGYEDPSELTFYVELEKMTNVTLDFTVVNVVSVSESFSLVCASGDYPDIFSQCTSYYTGGGAAMIEDEILLDLVDYLDYMPHYSALMEENEELERASYTDDGGIPQFMAVYDGAFVNRGLFVRSDWLEELGMDLPETYDDWYDYLLAVKTEYDVSIPSGEENAVPVTGFYGSTSEGFAVRDGEVIYVYADEEIQSEYLALCEKWYDAGLYTTEVLLDDYYSDSDLQGMVTSSNMVMLNTDIDQYLVFQDEVEITATKLPVIHEGDTPYDAYNQDTVGNGNAISTTCENVETLVAYMDYWYSDAVIELANWGVEGETFTIDDEGNYSYTDMVLNFSGGLNLATSVYAAGWEPTVIDFHRKDAAYTEDQLAALELWDINDDSMNFPSYTSFTVDEQSIISSLYPDIETYVDENYTMFKVGQLSYESDFQSFVDTLYDMGLQEILDVYQAVYDRYMAR